MFKRLAVSLILVAALASAQRGGGGGGEGEGEGGGGGMGRGGGMGGGGGGGMGGMRVVQKSKLELFADKLKLSNEQKEELVKILSAGREKAMPIRSQLDNGRVAIAQAIIEGKADEAKKFLDAYGNLEGQMAGIEAEVFGKIVATLKPNQQSKAGQAFPYLAGVYEPVAGRGGQGRGGRGGNRGGGGR